MINRFEVAGYWGPRKESTIECARRLSKFLQGLSSYDEALGNWFETGYSRKQGLAHRIIPENLKHMEHLVSGGQICDDVMRDKIPELGFNVALWNGENPPREASLNIGCGLYSTVPGLSNSVFLELPEYFNAKVDVKKMRKLVAFLAMSWNPDWAGAFSSQARMTRDFDTERPFVDWVLYVSDKLNPVEQITKPSYLEQLRGLGFLVVVQEEPVKIDNPFHMKNVYQVEKAFDLGP